MSNDMSNAPVSGAPMMEPPRPTSMFQTWMDAVTKPNEATYARIAGSPQAKATTAFLWVFIAALVQAFISFLVSGTTQNEILKQFGGGQNLPTPGLSSRVVSLICGAPIAAVIGVVIFALLVGVIYLIARAFGGRTGFDQLAYTLAAIMVPINLVGAVLSLFSAIPLVGICFGILGLVLALYALVLYIIAVKAVEQISYTGAVVSVLALPVVLCLCVACAAIAGFAALGPAIGNVFSGIGPFPIPTP